MTTTHRTLLAFVAAGLFGLPLRAQVITGTPPFGSFTGGPDVVNLANLNDHITIPIFHKSGRGMNFTYDLIYDSAVWYPVASGASQTWQPVANLGWGGQTQVMTGYATFSSTFQACGSGHTRTGNLTTYTNWVYYDSFGVPHPVSGTSYFVTGTCSGFLTSGFINTAADGSGYVLNVNGGSVTNVTAKNGTVINPPVGASSTGGISTDRNGNQINVSSGGIFTDTLGTTALTVAGLGTAASPMTFTYSAPGPTGAGVPAAVTVHYTNYTVATNFALSPIIDYKSMAPVPLVSSIVLPDSSQYTFQYEATPSTLPLGACIPYAGTTCVTARVTYITLPTGGTISYSYTGGNNGILLDGTTATLTRNTPDGNWTYAHVKNAGSASTTTITDPQSNQTSIQFQGIYETQRKVYQGLATGTPLRTWNACYNGSASPCTATAITLPITQRSVLDQYGSTGLQCRHNYVYNLVGGLTELDDYDYSSGTPTSLLRQVLITFAALANITSFQQQVTVKNGSGAIVSQTSYNYDETTPTVTSGVAQHVPVTTSRGNLTSVHYPVTSLVSHLSYYDTGSPNVSTDINGATTTFNYSSNAADCQMAFPTGVTEAISTLTQSYTWNCTGGVRLTSTDENSKVTSTTYNDADFWRPSAQTDQLGNQTVFSYQPNPTYCCPTAVASSMTFNGGNSVTEDIHYMDGLGRTYVNQLLQSPSSSTLDSVSYTFDANGRPYSVSVPCVTTYTGTCSTPKTTQTYDALDRPLQTTDGGGGTVTFSYPQNDVLMTIGPAPTGENTKRRQLEYDSLGRLTSVCELTTLSGSGTCGQTTTQPGYWTKYTYDALGDLLTVTQNAQATAGNQQTRGYVYDAMGRLTSETNPETGTTTYTYDSIVSGNCAATFKGDLIKRGDVVGNATCFTYDVLHRPLTVTYYGPYASTTAMKVLYYDTSHFNTTSNTLGRLASAGTCVNPSCAGNWLTAEDFSYSARGEITDVYELTTHSYPLFYHVSQTYWPNGSPNVLSGNIGLPTITYGADGEGRPSTVSASSGQNPVTATTYGMYASPFQLAVTFGSGDSDVFGYDSNTFRLNQYQFKIGAQTVTGNLGWNSNGNLGSLNIADPFSAANTQNCSFAADDLSRINQVSCGAVWGQNYSYDPFGNIQKNAIAGTGGSSFTPTYQSSPSITNRISTVGGVSATYDANGNSLNDTFRTATWDADSNPVTIGAVSLTYDAFDRMVDQSVGGTNSEIVYSPAGVKLALMNGSTLTKAFVPLTGGSVAVYNASGLAYYRHTDHLGSSRFASTPVQTLYSDTAYSPFGEPYASSGALDNSFTGQNQDTTVGLYDFLYREYDPSQSRWTSPDPAGVASPDPTDPQSWNRYSYVANRPLTFVDRFGLYCEYFNDANTDVESLDYDSSLGECGDSGGTWIDPSDNGGFGPCTPGAICINAYGTNPSSGTSAGGGITIWSILSSYWQQVPWSGTVLVSLVDFGPEASGGIGFTGAYIPKTDTVCGGLAGGPMTPAGGRSWSVGPLTMGDLGNARAILVGGSVFAGVQSPNPFVGAQVTGNSSGNLGGPTIGGEGAAAGASASFCKDGGGKYVRSYLKAVVSNLDGLITP